MKTHVFVPYFPSEMDPNVVIRIAGGEPFDENRSGALSLDNGVTWTMLESSPPAASNGLISGSIAISPTNCQHFVWCPLSNVPYVSKDSGKSWVKSNGAVSGICGDANKWEGGIYTRFGRDGINGKYYYMVDTTGGYNHFYVSDDGGYNWNVTKNDLPVSDYGYNTYLSSDWANSGNVCICTGWNGLLCTTDYGVTWNRNDEIALCRLVTFGRGQNLMNESVIYVFGISENDHNNNVTNEGMYYGGDGTDFVKMNNDSFALGNGPRLMVGDRQTFGRVYIGSSGRGVYYSSAINS